MQVFGRSYFELDKSIPMEMEFPFASDIHRPGNFYLYFIRNVPYTGKTAGRTSLSMLQNSTSYDIFANQKNTKQ